MYSIPDVPVTPFIFENAASHPTKAALVDGPSGRSYDYATLQFMVQRFAGGLVARGFQPGEVLMILAPNIPEYAIALHGTLVCGGTVTTVNPTYTARELRHQIEDSGATWLFTIPLFLPLARAGNGGTGAASDASSSWARPSRPTTSWTHSPWPAATRTRVTPPWIRRRRWPSCPTPAARPETPKG